MPATLNPTRKSLLKKNLLSGKPATQALRDSGYAETYAHRSTDAQCVKVCNAEIKEELEHFNVTKEFVIDGLAKEARTAEKPTDRIAAMSWLGKYLAMFTEKTQNSTEIVDKTSINDAVSSRLRELGILQ